ncbi:MAG TPA: FAD-dependent oxidoreductase, partial [Pseudomonadales bacterium]|nr:FAD-dependent oxidoreductase [Pseudomonadales bacterium]
EEMKAHPGIKPLLEGSEMKEYTAHLIPEGGYNAMPKLYGDGWMIAGDSGMFVNGVHREGSNLAMTTGQLAAQTVIELKSENKPLNQKNLARYRQKLDASFVMKDLKKYRRLPHVVEKNQQFFTTYPELINRAAHTLIAVDGIDKRTKERAIRRNFVMKRSRLGLVSDAFKLWRAFE